MKKTLLFAAVLCGLTSFAAEPVAVWNGDLADGSVKGSFTMSKTAESVSFADGCATISAVTGGSTPTGVVVSFPNAGSDITVAGKMTVFVKYSGFSASTSNNSLISLVCPNANNEVVAYLNGGTKAGLAHSVTTSSAGTQGVSSTAITFPTEGIMMLSIANDGATSDTTLRGTRFAVAAKNTDGTYGDFILGQYTPGIKWGSGQNITEIKVGGTIAQIGHYHRPAMKVEGVSVYVEATSIATANTMKNDIFATPEPEEPKVEPVLLVNFGTSTPAGWVSCGETSKGGNVPQNGTLGQTGSDATFKVEGGGNFFNESNANSGVTLVTGDGATIPEAILTEMKTSLGLSDQVVLDDTVYKTGLMNGGYNNHTATIAGLNKDSKYIVYAGFGMKKDTQCQGFTLNTSGHCESIEKLEYYVTVAGTNTQVSDGYTAFTQGTNVRPGVGGLMIVRMTNVVPTSEGKIQFIPAGERAGINFLAVAKVNESKPTSKTFDISGSVSYADLETEGLTSATLNLTADATVTFTEAVSAALTFTGSGNLTVKGAQHLTIANVTDAGVTGNITYEFGGAYTAADGLKNKIKAASTKYKFVFTGNATVDFTSANLGTINTHLVFSGDASTLKITNGNNKFAASATYDNPTILVERGTLTFYGHDVTGWAAGTDANGIVRVMKDATLQLENHDTGTFYYNQRIAIDAGATVNVGSSLNGNQFRMTEGVNGQQIWVQDCASDMTAMPAKLVLTSGQLALAKDGSAQGIGVYVGKNAKLQITGMINSMNNAQNQAVDNTFARPIKKTGAGVLEVSGTHGVTYEVAGGSIGGDATVQKVNLASGTSLVLKDNKALKVQTVLTLPKPINLVCEPVHGMTVITPPSDMEGYTATINGSEKTYELFMDGGALKLKYKTPPAFPEGFGDFVIEVANGKVGEVSVDVSKLSLNDYERDSGVSYKLDFGGDKIVAGARTDNIVTFNLATGDFFTEHVYRGDFVVEFPDGEVKKPITVYEGVRTPTWISSELIIRKQGTINDAQGETIKLEDEESILNHDPDYIDNCDSVYMVTLSASEAVDADTESVGDSQGGLRLVKVDENTVKLEYLYNDEGDNNTVKWGDQWPDGTKTGTVTLALNASVTVRVEFHYAKGEDGDTSYVKYSIGEDYATSVTSWATAKKVTEVFIADGTVLPDDLKGLFQLDSAVVVDIEIEPGDEVVGIEADNDVEAQKIASKLKVGISEAVAAVLTTAAQKEEYRAYFKIVAVKSEDGTYTAQVAFADAVKSDIEKDIAEALGDVIESFNTGANVEIAAKPGLYYGVKRGESLDKLDIEETTLATGETVTISITKPDNSKSHFYRIIVSPTPAETK